MDKFPGAFSNDSIFLVIAEMATPSYWRQLALHTPVLWTLIDVDIDWIREQNHLWTKFLLDTVLKRSNQLLLDVVILYPLYMQESQLCSRWQGLFDRLCDETERWRSFHLTSKFSWGYKEFPICSPPQGTSFASLVEVKISGEHRGKAVALFRALGGSPRLERLCLDRFDNVKDIIPDFPWFKLVELEVCRHYMYELDFDFLRNLLPLCSNLQTFSCPMYKWEMISLGGRLPRTTPPSAHHIVNLSLKKRVSTERIARDLGLSSLSLPSLQYLEVDEQFVQGAAQIADLIERSGCSLTSLWFSNVDIMSVMSIIRLIRLPQVQESLQELVLSGSIYGKTLLECFFGACDSTTDMAKDPCFFLPSLRKLNINSFMVGALSR